MPAVAWRSDEPDRPNPRLGRSEGSHHRAVTFLRDRMQRLVTQCAVLARAVRHPRTPWYARVVGTLTLLYALSPIDLIPDFIPVLGLLDDLVLVPIGIWLTVKMIPNEVWAECEAQVAGYGERPGSDWRGALIVVAIWLGLLVVGLLVLRRIW